MAVALPNLVLWSDASVSEVFHRLNLTEAFLEDIADRPGYEPPGKDGLILVGYSPQVSAPLTESVKDIKLRIEGVIQTDLDAAEPPASKLQVVVKCIIYRGKELPDKLTLKEQNVDIQRSIHIVLAKKKRFGIF